MAPDDLMGDPGPAEAMVRRAVEAEREAIAQWLERQFTYGDPYQRNLFGKSYGQTFAAAIRRRGA